MNQAKRRRKRGDPRTATFLTLYHWMLASEAFLALSPHAVKWVICAARRYSGRNNGRIGFSVREAAKEIGCALNTAHEAQKDAIKAGFAVAETQGGFSLKNRHSTEWRLTFLPTYDGDRLVDPTNDFMRQPRPSKIQNAVSPHATDGLTS